MLENSRILIIEDNVKLKLILADFLELKGAEVDFSDNGELGIKLAMEQEFDAIILDVMIPKKNGLKVARELRESGSSTPILMLTALNGQEDLVNGFEHGADDFLTKPFQFPELQARLSALIKRYRGNVASTSLSFGELEIDTKTKIAKRAGHKLVLTPVMYQIIVILIKAQGSVVSKDSLIHQIWGKDTPEKDVLRSHIYLLRSALDKPFKKSMLKTVPKFGYRLEA